MIGAKENSAATLSSAKMTIKLCDPLNWISTYAEFDDPVFYELLLEENRSCGKKSLSCS